MERTRTLPQSVGMSLSGGGFRAAAFHLGTLSYLHRVGLLDKLELLSTVSGGTFTGVKLALARLETVPLETAFRAYYAELRDVRIFARALQLLGDSRVLENSSGRKNLITCAAHVYSTVLFQKPNGKPYYFADVLDGDTKRLREISFNATDFRTGLAFRFQKTSDGLIGNLRNSLSPADAGRLRLGDIVAASSCFPAGFEPFEFPGDLVWKDDIPAGVSTQFAELRSPLMDGGVYDNQGLESLLLADRRRRNGPAGAGVDLIFISDTDPLVKSLYAVPSSVAQTILASKPSWAVSLLCRIDPKLKWLDWTSQALVILCWLVVLASAVNMVVTGFSETGAGWLAPILTSVLPAVLAGGTAFLMSGLRGFITKDLLARIPQLRVAAWRDLRELPLSRALDMVAFRVSSLFALASSVFMKRIRSAGLARIFDAPEYQGRIVSNLIYQLTPDYPWVFDTPERDKKMLPGLTPELIARLKAVSKPSGSMQHCAAIADEMPTTLWFNNESELPALVAAGQFTTCLNLMKFVARTRVFDAAANSFVGEVEPFWEQLLADWTKFNAHPQFLLPEMEQRAQNSATGKNEAQDALGS